MSPSTAVERKDLFSQRLGSATEKRQMSSLNGQKHVNYIELEKGNTQLMGTHTGLPTPQRRQVQKCDVKDGPPGLPIAEA